jgi:hypothetical protein
LRNSIPILAATPATSLLGDFRKQARTIHFLRRPAPRSEGLEKPNRINLYIGFANRILYLVFRRLELSSTVGGICLEQLSLAIRKRADSNLLAKPNGFSPSTVSSRIFSE